MGQCRKNLELIAFYERSFCTQSSCEYLSWAYQTSHWRNSFSRISSFKWGQPRMCWGEHVLKSNWHRFSSEVIFFSLNSELNLLLHKAIQIKDQVESWDDYNVWIWVRREWKPDKGKSTWRSFVIASIITGSHMATVIIWSPPQVGEPSRYLAIRKFPHMPRKPGWYVLCVAPILLCMLSPRQRAQPPAPGEKFKTISRTAATGSQAGREKARPGESCWEGPQSTGF